MYSFIKRVFDILGALALLPIVLLVVMVFAPIIWLTDRGPVFYNAERMGRNGKIFKMFKLRSMYVNAPDLRNEDGSTFNSDSDPRVTPIGKILRKTSLDELPQIINVLLGDMSFVGPRPSLTTTPYSEYDPVRIKRVSVRPGITGYSQAYFRNSISQEEKFKEDANYVDNISIWLDIKILLKTIMAVLYRENIYSTNN